MDKKKWLLLLWLHLPKVEGGGSQVLPLEEDKQATTVLNSAHVEVFAPNTEFRNRQLKGLFPNIPYSFCQHWEFLSLPVIWRWEPPAQAALHRKLTIKQNPDILSTEYPSKPTEDLKEWRAVSCQLTWKLRCLVHDAPATQDTALP